MAAKAWGGRFQEQTDPRVERFTESISFDARLAPFDIQGSQAHARMLAKVGILTDTEAEDIVNELNAIRKQIEQGEFEFRMELEDIHMHIETALIAKLGDTGRKLHTSRSRNDQVATDIKLFTRHHLDRISELLVDLQKAFVSRCDDDADVILPAYTHLQRAQPVMANHFWLAWCEKFARDQQRLIDTRKRVNISPLGCAALAGTTLPNDREMTAYLLGFEQIARNSLDVSSDRDYMLEFLCDLAQVALHLSSWAEEWILWCTTEFDFLKLRDAYTTGSSIMPQKKNPDVLELIRGKTARVTAAVNHNMMLLKGLPMAYNRDLQEDKLALFDAIDTIEACLELAATIVETSSLNREAIDSRLEDGFLDATALMEYLIKQQVPMRSGHEIVGQLVALCESKKCRLNDLPLEELQNANPAIEDSVYGVLGTKNAVEALVSYGSGGAKAVAEQVTYWKEKLELQ